MEAVLDRVSPGRNLSPSQVERGKIAIRELHCLGGRSTTDDNYSRKRNAKKMSTHEINLDVISKVSSFVDAIVGLVNEKHVDVCDTDCRGFTTDVALSHRGMDNYVFNQVVVALYRGDNDILQTLLSSHTFHTRAAASSKLRVLNQIRILDFCHSREQTKIRHDVFKTLVSSPKIDVTGTPGYMCLYNLVLNLYWRMERSSVHDEYSTDFTSMICALLDAGARVLSPNLLLVRNERNALHKRFGELSDEETARLKLWNTILETMGEQDNP